MGLRVAGYIRSVRRVLDKVGDDWTPYEAFARAYNGGGNPAQDIELGEALGLVEHNGGSGYPALDRMIGMDRVHEADPKERSYRLSLAGRIVRALVLY